ncbi:hypothetical protein HanRHA438_Chr05g0209561 [Helianthus annuus]|nr:hypothetical protein HanRHA438_Chr05g0209561 [Helianthus annuus]
MGAMWRTLHFARSQRHEPFESCLCIFDRSHVVKHWGYRDQVACQPWQAGARVHGAWTLM